MPDIHIDITQLGVSLDEQIGAQMSKAITTSVKNSLSLIKDEWQRRAQGVLHSTLPLYLQGLDFNSVVYPLNNDPFSGAVILRGTLPNMLENGCAPFDEKIGFSKSSRKHPTKDGGWYLTIPFRHSTPGAFMYGQPMSKPIYARAKLLQHKESLSVPGGQKTSWTGYVHKNNIDDGLTRIIKSYKNVNTGKVTNQSQYFTFRRVSNNSDPLSWWHPGLNGVNLARQLEPYAKRTFALELERNIKASLQ